MTTVRARTRRVTATATATAATATTAATDPDSARSASITECAGRPGSWIVRPHRVLAEYGIGTDDDPTRAAYLERGLQVVNEAIARGVDVRGLFHWTGVDNYEWLHGFDVSFGIIDRDRNVRPSARVLQREAKP